MPRARTKPPKKDQGELVLSKPAAPVYKAFCFPDDDSDMIVDTSGDTFSASPEDAIRALFQQMPGDILAKITIASLFTKNDQPIEVDADATTDKAIRYLVMIRIIANDVDEFEAAKSEGGDYDFMLRLKDLTQGYLNAMQDYTIEELHLRNEGTGEAPKWKIISATIRATDPSAMTSTMPIKISL